MARSGRAVCARCGHDKPAYDVVCGGCGDRPEGDALLVAWLLSREHLDDPDLDHAAARVRQGHPVRPSAAQLERARTALGTQPAGDAGLSVAAWIGVAAASVVVTSAPGWATWWWWRTERPRTARQVLAASLVGAAAFMAWAWAG